MASADQRWPNPLSPISRRLSQIQMLLHVGNQLVETFSTSFKGLSWIGIPLILTHRLQLR